MAGFLGTIAGRIRLDVSQAVAGYAAVRAANASTLYALRGSSTAFIAAGKGMLVAGGLMAAVFYKAVDAAAEFERKMDFFGAVTNSTADEMQRASDKALQLGQDTIYSADQIAQSFVELGKAGISANQIIDGVGDAVAHLGAAADIPLTQAADIITAAVQTFSLNAKDAVHVADLLAGAANASIVEVEDLGVSLKYVGGIAASVHVPIESVIDALSLLGKAGIKGSTAGTSLRQIMVSLTGTSKKATNELKKLGIITKNGTNLFVNQKGQIKPLSEVFQILQDHTKGLTEAQRLAAFKVIFNNRALAAAQILTQAGAKGFAAMNKEIGKTTAADTAAKRLDNLSGDIEILRGNIETFFIRAGTPFQGFLRTIVQGITNVIQVFANLPSGVQTGIFAFLAIAGALLLFMGTVSLIVGTVLKFIQVIKLFGFAFTFISNIVKGFIVVMRLLGLAFLTNPIGIIITAVALLVVGFILLYQHSETFRNFIGKVGEFFVAVWNKVLDFFKGVPDFFSNLWDNIKNFFGAGIEWIKEHWQLLVVIFAGPIAWVIALIFKFKDQIIGFFQTLWQRTVEIVGNMFSGIVDFFAKLPERVAYWIGFLIGRAIRLWIDWQTFLWTKTAEIITGVVNFFKEMPGKVMAWFQDLYNKAVVLWNFLRTWLINKALEIVNGIINWIKLLPGRVAAWFTEMKNKAIAIATALWQAAVRIASNILNGVINFIKLLPGRVVSFFLDLKNRGSAVLTDAWKKAVEIAGKLKDGFINAIKALPGLVAEVFNKVLSAIGNVGSALWEKAKSVASSLWQGFKDGLGINSPSYLEKAMFQINKTFGIEIPKMKRQVQKIQTFTDDVVTNNPAARAGTAAGLALTKLTNQARLLQSAQLAVAGPRVGLSQAVSRPGAVPGALQDSKKGDSVVNVTVNNPKPEKASESLYRASQRLAWTK